MDAGRLPASRSDPGTMAHTSGLNPLSGNGLRGTHTGACGLGDAEADENALLIQFLDRFGRVASKSGFLSVPSPVIDRGASAQTREVLKKSRSRKKAM